MAKKYNKILIIIAFSVIIFLVVYASTSLQSILFNSINSLGDYLKENKVLGGAIFVAISAISVLLSPFSSIPLVPSAIVAWGNELAFLLLFLGWIAGSITAYFIGSFSRDKIIKRFVSLEKIEYYKEHISSRSQFWLVFLFRLAIPSEVAGYTLGVIRYKFSKYLLATILTELPFALFVIYSGSVLVDGKISYFAGIILIGSLAIYFIYREFQRIIRGQ